MSSFLSFLALCVHQMCGFSCHVCFKCHVKFYSGVKLGLKEDILLCCFWLKCQLYILLPLYKTQPDVGRLVVGWLTLKQQLLSSKVLTARIRSKEKKKK